MHVAEDYKSRLLNWPQIKDGGSAGLQTLSDFLFRCHEVVRIGGFSGELDSTPTLTQVSAKFPSYSGVKWCRHPYGSGKKSGLNVSSVAKFVQFFKEEFDLANDPVLSPDVLKRVRKFLETTKDNRGRGRNKADSFVNSTIQEQCAMQGTHFTKRREFEKKRVEERREFVMTGGLCFWLPEDRSPV